jgi:hypothetical protein
MSEDLNRRQFVAGAATVAAASVLPLSIDAAAPVAEPEMLWPTDTVAQRCACIVRCMQEHIAEKSGIPANDVTTEDIYDIVWRFGLSLDEVVDALRLVKEQDASPGKFKVPAPPTIPWKSAEEWAAWYDGDDAWNRGWEQGRRRAEEQKRQEAYRIWQQNQMFRDCYRNEVAWRKRLEAQILSTPDASAGPSPS